MNAQARHFDAVVIGTGFGGAVTACRLVEAGFRVCVLERGRRYGPSDFPQYPIDDLLAGEEDVPSTAPLPDFSRWLWRIDHGIYDVRDLGDAVAVQAAGFGGGSLVYANVHLRPPRRVFAQGWPAEYNADEAGGWRLTPYFDLAAFTLNVSLVPHQLAKTLQLRSAGARAGAHQGGADWFRVPLAINFDSASAGPGDPERPACDMRGRCCFGCDRQAKNTLDLNYLARAERADPARGEHPPDIRTMAEATTITRSNGGFAVKYRDLLLNEDGDGNQVVEADAVFLCAGSINTTRLLMQNSQLWPAIWSTLGGSGPLGSHYHPNADSLAMAFDCDEPHEPDYGPTITSALLFQRPGEGPYRQSLDFENGTCQAGAAAPVRGAMVRGVRSGAVAMLAYEPLLDWGDWTAGSATGALALIVADEETREFTQGEPLEISGGARANVRSTLTTHDHWFLAEDGGYPPEMAPLLGVFRSPLWLRRNRFKEPGRAEAFRPPSRSTQPVLRVQWLADTLSGTAAERSSASLLETDAYDTSKDLLQAPIRSLFPQWFVGGLDDQRKEFVARAGAFALPQLGRVLDRLSESMGEQIGPTALSVLGFGNASTPNQKKSVLLRGLLRQALQTVAGGEVAVADKVAEALADVLPLNPEQLLNVASHLVLWALAYGETDERSAMILTMGRDLYRGRLSAGARPEDLVAILPSPVLDSSAVLQERVLRDIARTWGGELRTNPAWTPLTTRLTVHSQGGCPMGPDAAHGVTDAWGQVHGCEGLYVMDAAAFPTSVGVNPSAAIAAVAEFKIEHFIRTNRRAPKPGWTARDMAAARAWADAGGRRADLDPLNARTSRTPPPREDVLGLTFLEKMVGFRAPDTDYAIDWDSLAAFRAHVPRFLQIEQHGFGERLEIRADFRAVVGDLAHLVSREAVGNFRNIRLEGAITLAQDGQPTSTWALAPGSVLQLFVLPPAGDDELTKFIRYDLRFEERSPWLRLRAAKVLHNGPGNDLWSDTSTLYFELSSGTAMERGILRVTLNDFLRMQLPSMEITGTGDPARKQWALAAFYRYFARELVDVYVGRLDHVNEFLKKLFTGIHV